ncbi:MAG: 1,4-dihydroxy-2-naphthoate octaprenyltransferase [Flavobacteriales bacterium]|nr:1,4-dihydroxy-2-naphthoate octaprenyltransferase [Flavobacteriales bacterium]
MAGSVNIWIKAARLRTLPLAIGGIILGSALAAYEYYFDGYIFALSLLTAISLQILSNFANDYGDFQKGTDLKANRTDRALASGELDQNGMRKALYFISSLTLLLGLALLIISFKKVNSLFLIWFLIGLSAIAAALKYTIGNRAYGYSGFGDLFVLIFFGPVAVLGVYFMMTGMLNTNVLIAGFAFGLLCTLVLNINNLRDENSDRDSGKRTLIVKLGYTKGIYYHLILTGLAFLLFFLFTGLTDTEIDRYIVMIFGLYYFTLAFRLKKIENSKESFNLFLKQTSILNLVFVLLLAFTWLT